MMNMESAAMHLLHLHGVERHDGELPDGLLDHATDPEEALFLVAEWVAEQTRPYPKPRALTVLHHARTISAMTSGWAAGTGTDKEA